MFSKSLPTVVGALFVAHTSAQLLFSPGIKSGIAISVLEQGKDAYFNAVMSKINGIQIPDIVSPDGKNYMKDNHFYYESNAGNVEFTTDVVNNALVLTARKVSAQFWSNDFYYKYAPLMVASGSLEVDLNTIKFVIGLGFGTQILPDGREVPYVTGQDVQVKIDRFDLHISIHGNFWSDAVNLITPFIKGTVCDLIESSLYTALDTTMPNLINKGMVKSDGFLHTPLVPTWWFDWETPGAAIVSDYAFMVQIKGLMFDTVYGEESPAVTIPSMPNFDKLKPEGYQNYVSTYSLDGFFGSLTEETTITGWVNKAYSTKITTGELNAFLPGIQGYYGDVPVAIKFEIQKLGSFSVTEANPMIGALGTITLEFYAMTSTGPDLATSMTLVDTSFGFTVLVDNMTMNMQLATTNVDKITVNSCSFGKLSALLLKTELNNFFRVFTPIINHDLQNHAFTVPSNIFGIFTLSNLTIGYYNDYLYLGMTPTFITPTYEAVQEQLQIYQ